MIAILDRVILAQGIPPVPIPPQAWATNENGIYLDPMSGKWIPPSSFPDDSPEALRKLNAAVEVSLKDLSTARSDAEKRLSDDSQYQTLAASLEEAKSELTKAATTEERGKAAMDKMSASSKLNAYVEAHSTGDPQVSLAKKNAADCQNAVTAWIKEHEYTSVDEMIQMCPAVKWLAQLDANYEKYLWADQWLKQTNAGLEKTLNGRKANLVMVIDSVEQNTATIKQLKLLGDRYKGKSVALSGLKFEKASNSSVGDLPGITIDDNGLISHVNSTAFDRWIGFSARDSADEGFQYFFALKDHFGDLIADLKEGENIEVNGVVTDTMQAGEYAVICYAIRKSTSDARQGPRDIYATAKFKHLLIRQHATGIANPKIKPGSTVHVSGKLDTSLQQQDADSLIFNINLTDCNVLSVDGAAN
jgi:hypothetical protein